MRLIVAGVPFSLPSSLSAAERDTVLRIDALASPALPGTGDPFVLELVDDCFHDPMAFADRAPANVSADGALVRVRHRQYGADLDARARRGRIWRAQPDGGGVFVTLRVALSAALATSGALPLHAAGVALDGAGLVFHGPSGAGKTTISETSPVPVYSDELVVVLPGPWRLASSGFWGAGDERRAPEPAPLAGMFALDKGTATLIDALPPVLGLRSLIGQIMVPPLRDLWAAALATAGRLTAEVPTCRLTWAREDPPWAALSAWRAAR